MALAIGLWMTDFIHHIPSPMIGIGIGLLATLPRIGVLDVEDVRKLNFLTIIFVAAAISTGDILRETGRAEAHHRCGVRLARAVRRPALGTDSGAVLDRLRLPHLPGRRDLDAGDVAARC